MFVFLYDSFSTFSNDNHFDFSCANLIKDLDFTSCISLPVFLNDKKQAVLSDDDDIVDQSEKWMDKNAADEQQTHLVMAAQIGAILTCSSDLVLQQHNLIDQTDPLGNKATTTAAAAAMDQQSSVSSKTTEHISTQTLPTQKQNESSFLQLTADSNDYSIISKEILITPPPSTNTSSSADYKDDNNNNFNSINSSTNRANIESLVTR